MKVIKPITLTSGMLTSTNVSETYSAWSSGTTYNVGNRVTYGTRVYESLIDSNLGVTPDSDATKWLDYSPTNVWAMFDAQVSTQSTRTDFITVQVAPAQYFNSLALLNLNAISASVTVTAGAETLFSESYDLSETIIADWYQYFFEPYTLKTDLVVTDIPPSINAVIVVTVTNTSGLEARVGVMKLGNTYTFGDSTVGASLGIIDYSVKETDDFGVTTFIERSFSKRLDCRVFCENDNLTYITGVLQSLRANPTVWTYSEQTKFRPTVVYGYAKDWNIDIQYTNHCMLSLEIEGLI